MANAIGTGDQVSWNLSMQISLQISNMLDMSKRYMLRGKVFEVFFVMTEVRLLVQHHFKEEEKAEVDLLEKKINDISLKIKGLKIADDEESDDFEYESHDVKNKRQQLKSLLNQRYILIQRYRTKIVFLLDEYGYLMGRKEDGSQMF